VASAGGALVAFPGRSGGEQRPRLRAESIRFFSSHDDATVADEGARVQRDARTGGQKCRVYPVVPPSLVQIGYLVGCERDASVCATCQKMRCSSGPDDVRRSGLSVTTRVSTGCPYMSSLAPLATATDRHRVTGSLIDHVRAHTDAAAPA